MSKYVRSASFLLALYSCVNRYKEKNCTLIISHIIIVAILSRTASNT